MHALRHGKQELCRVPHLQGVMHVDAIMFDRPFHGFPAFRFNLASGARAAVVLGRHLCQKAVAQSQWRIAKTPQVATFQEFRIDNGAGGDDLGAPWSDTGDFAPLFEVPVTIAPSDRPIGTHVFTAQADKADSNVLRWTVVTVPPSAHAAMRASDARGSPWLPVQINRMRSAGT